MDILEKFYHVFIKKFLNMLLNFQIKHSFSIYSYWKYFSSEKNQIFSSICLYGKIMDILVKFYSCFYKKSLNVFKYITKFQNKTLIFNSFLFKKKLLRKIGFLNMFLLYGKRMNILEEFYHIFIKEASASKHVTKFPNKTTIFNLFLFKKNFFEKNRKCKFFSNFCLCGK